METKIYKKVHRDILIEYTYDDAIMQIRQTRCIALPNEGFENTLRKLEKK